MLEMNKNIYAYVPARDIAEDARFSFELDKRFWMPYRKGFTLRGMTVLFFLACFPPLAQAETCTATPDCKTLGYTETSCPDGGVKCPWNTSLMYCCKKCVTCEVKTCQAGDVLYGDKKCYTCLANRLPGQVPIGVVFSSGKAVGLVDLSTSATWSNANTLCSNHKPGGISGWYLPSKDELLAMYSNIEAVQIGLRSVVDGSKLASTYYWSSFFNVNYDGCNYYWIVNPVSGSSNYWGDSSYQTYYVRPVLEF